MPNTFAYIALFAWPIVVFALFRVLPRPTALVASIVGGYLLLPVRVGIDLPMLPAIDKTLVPAFSAAIMCLLSRDAPSRRRRPEPIAQAATVEDKTKDSSLRATERSRARPGGQEVRRAKQFGRGRGIEKLLITVLFLSPFLTVLGNAEPYFTGSRVIRGLQLYDGASMVLSILVSTIPYFLARRYLASTESQKVILNILVVSALMYSVLALYEVRMSPQLHTKIYGFFPHVFAQHMRDGGFRPLVFLNHGLLVAIFFAMAIAAAFVLWRVENVRRKWLFAGLWLTITLIFCKSLGSIIIVMIFLPIVVFVRFRGQMLFSSIIVLVVLFYPLMRGAGLIPVNTIVEMAREIDPSRARSLQFRIDNEEVLLDRANAKPFLGWGGWGRSRIYSESTGRDISVTDGVWIIIAGQFGWVGYIAHFGTLVLPIILIGMRRGASQGNYVTSGLCLILTANMVDMIPNSSLTPLSWLIAGSLMGSVIARENVIKSDVINEKIKETNFRNINSRDVGDKNYLASFEFTPSFQRRRRRSFRSG